MQKERSRMQEQKEQEKPQSEFIQRKSLCQLIYKKLENVTTITSGQYEQTLKKYPPLGSLYSLVKEFHTAIFSKKPEKLDTWIESAQKQNHTRTAIICGRYIERFNSYQKWDYLSF